MKIVNPLYDYAFKYLMQNERLAKHVLSVLLDCEIEELTIEQQEIVSVDEIRSLKLYRLDFSAVIVNDLGERQKVLIELQKSKFPTNLLRFRDYLGESYRKKTRVLNSSGIEEEVIYPIISIYILGYNLPELPHLAVSIDHKITDTITKEELTVSSDFINLLNHQSRIIQVRRLAAKRQSRLEQFLMLFNQAWVTSEKYILNLEEVPVEFKDMVRYLSVPVQDEAFKNQLKGEEEIDGIFKNIELELVEAKQREEAAKQEAEAAKQGDEEAKQREEEAKQREEEAKQREEEAKQQAVALQLQFAKHLLEQGMPISQIAAITGLDEATLNQLDV